MYALTDLPAAIRESPGTRSPTDAELEGLRARGNRGDLDEIRLGPLCRPEVLLSVRDCVFHGPSLLLGPSGLELEGSTLRGAIVACASVRGSTVSHSILGDGVTVGQQSVVDSSVLLPFRQVVGGDLHLFQLFINASHVTDCVLWGGTDVGPFCHLRSHSVIGPFVHVGTGTEVKASCILGATPRNKVELPHRSYVGNASVKALRIEAPFGTPPYYEELERKLPALLFGRIEAVVADEDVPGAVQPLERVRVRHGGEELVLEVEGVNFGALTTTSNFDPRSGGWKMPSNVEAGARFGILAMIQAPAHVAPGVLVASGAKIGGASVPPASLVLPRAESGGVLPGYLHDNRARLGDGTAESVALTRAYLLQLRSLQHVLFRAAGEATGLERLALSRAHAAIGFQLAELASWLHRYLDLVKLSAERISASLPTLADLERRERLEARLAEQRRVFELAPTQIAELDAMRAEIHREAETLDFRAALGSLAREHAVHFARRALERPELLRLLPAASAAEEAEVREEIAAARESFAIGRLFGTSGVRGVFCDEHPRPPTAALEREGVLSPSFAYLLGRALGRQLQRRGEPPAAGIATDVRQSGAVLAAALREGLTEEGVDVADHGVCTTPAASAFDDRMMLVVTASHNGPAHNGIKVFLDGIPLSRALEDEAEEELRVLEALALRGRGLPPLRDAGRGRVRDATRETYERHLGDLRAELDRLGLVGKLRKRRLPVDLARGAAAAHVRNDEIVPSPPMAVLLEEGVVLVAYGGERDGARVNERLGAAYLYGEGRATVDGVERDVAPSEAEIAALARGEHGYGAGRVDGRTAGEPASRSVYWPASLEIDPQLAREGRPVAGGHLAFLDLDAPPREPLRKAIEEAMERFPLLTALSVDGDADRLVLVDAVSARRDPPVLTGDRLLMVFAAYAPRDAQRVVFTVESDLAIEKMLEARDVPFDVVTVGDRAVAECALARSRSGGRGAILGGEPSGHLLFASPEQGRPLVDDPFVAHLRVLGLVERGGRSIGDLIRALEGEHPTVATARKPDAWARDPQTGSEGIPLAEKAHLTLWARGEPKRLSAYAAHFVSEYSRIFGEGYARTFHGAGARVEVRLGPAMEELTRGPVEAGPGKREERIGEVRIQAPDGETERLSVTLQITAVDYYGPDDIVLRFYATDAQGRPTKAGEVVARNSGTSAKNAAYNKLWPVHAPTGRRAEPLVARDALSETARRRAELTDRWVIEVLRKT